APSKGLLVTSKGIVLTLAKRAHQPGERTQLKDRQLRTAVIRVNFKGGSPTAGAVGRDELPSQSHYFLGNDPRKWHTQVPHYGRVELAEVFPGINVALYGSEQELECDFVLAAGADPRVVGLEFEGVEGLRTEGGDLVIATSLGEIRQRKPVVYQVGARGARELVSAEYVLKGDREVSFTVG